MSQARNHAPKCPESVHKGAGSGAGRLSSDV